MKPGPLAFAVALAALLVWRRRRLEPTLLIGGALGVAGLAVYGSGLIELPNLEHLLEEAGAALGQWTYLVVAVMAFLETGAFVGLLAPGETVMVFGGVVAGQGRVEFTTLLPLVWASAVLGDLTSFALGRRLGRSFLERHGRKVSITPERLRSVEVFFDRHGGKAILVGRFVGLVRAIAPFLAGSSGMPLRRFVPYDIVGAGLWSTAFLTLGYVFWQSFGTVLDYAEKGALALGSTIAAVVALVWVVRRLRVPEERRRLQAAIIATLERPALRPVGRLARPLWRRSRKPRRFVWQRLTPGELGLEITTLSAISLVGGYAFGALVYNIGRERYTEGDLDALTIAGDLRTGALVDVAKALTHLGDFVVVVPAVAIVALVLAWRRRVLEALALSAGMVLTYAGVHLVKGLEDRPRPSDALVETAGSSFPSGHAAYGVAWIALAVIAGRKLPGLGGHVSLVAVAVALATVVALTRVYLRAHYLSDVVAGAGMAAAIFALCGIAAIVVAHVRHNGRDT